MRHYVILYIIAIMAMASGCSAYDAPFNPRNCSVNPVIVI